MLPYVVNVENQAIGTSPCDLFEGLSGSVNPISIHRIEVTNDAIALESIRLALVLRTTAGSGGSAVTPRALAPLNTRAAAAVFNKNVTTPGTLGNTFDSWRWGQVYPLDIVLGKPELVIEIPANTRFALAMLSAPAAGKNFSYSIHFTER